MEFQQPGIVIFIDKELDGELSNYISFSGDPGYDFITKAGKYMPGAIKRMSDIENKKALLR